MTKLIRPAPLPLYYPGMPFPEPQKGLIRPRQMGDNGKASRQMEMGDRTYSVDANMFLSDGAAAITASGYSQYVGADGIVDFGGNQNVTITLPSIADVSTITPQQARLDAVCVIDVTAVTTSGTASEKLILVLSNDPAFGAGKTIQAGMMEFGAIVSQEQPNGFVTAAPNAVGGSRYELLFCSEQNNVKYQYAKLYVVIANSGSITFKAFIAVLPEP
jgi:hypothetical protein